MVRQKFVNTRKLGVFQKSLNDVELYSLILRTSTIDWMDGSEIGMAPIAGRKQKSKYPILLWVYKYKDVEEMSRTITHEVVHYAHPDLTDKVNESAIEAKTSSLIDNPLWQLMTYYKLLYAMHRAVKRSFEKNEAATIG